MNETRATQTIDAPAPAADVDAYEAANVDANVNVDEDQNAPVDLEAFKHAFRRHAAGVAVITTLAADGTPVGFTATSLASLAAVPPLATFNMAKSASTWPAIVANDRVVIHILGVRNRVLAQKLSGPNAERFVGDHWHAGPHGLPVLNGVTSWMVGRIVERVSVHNNAVVVVQVEGGGMGDDDAALLYHERNYRTPGAGV